MSRRRVGAALAIGLASLAVVTLWAWVLSPDTIEAGEVRRADAVVLFVGGRGERLEAATELVEAGAADALVIPNGWSGRWSDANVLCARQSDVEVICPVPDPDNTRGEARLIADIARERGWSSVVLVTSDYHVSRAALMLGRCFDGSVQAVSADSDLSFSRRIGRLGHEWFGHARARLFARGC